MKNFSKSVKIKIIMIAAAAALITGIIFLIIFLTQGGRGYRNISISEISGEVLAENNGKKYKAYKNMRLSDGFFLTTEIASYSRMLLDEDKYVKLEELSRACFEKVGSDKNRRTDIRLERGTMTVEVAEPLNEDEDFVVNTPNAVLAVRGTFFRIAVTENELGEDFTDVYTYGGTVACRRVMPDGTVVNEEVLIRDGYKARIKMDEIVTVYIEEQIEEKEDNVDPINVEEIPDDDIVDMYNASYNGHKLFMSTAELWDEINFRGIDLDKYHSVYDGGTIPKLNYDTETESTIGNETEITAFNTETVIPKDEGNPDIKPAENTYGNIVEIPGNAFEEPISDNRSENGNNENENFANSISEYNSVSQNAAYGTEARYNIPSEETTVTTVPAEAEETTAAPVTFSETETEEITEASEAVTTVTVSEPVNTAAVPSVTAPPVTETEPGTSASSEQLHTHSERTETVEASCTEEGRSITKCAECGAILSEEIIPAKGHSPIVDITEATLTSEGLRIVTCSVCGEVLERETLPKLALPVEADIFPDEAFREYIKTNVDTNRDGVLSDEEIKAVTEIDVSSTNIASLSGLEIFTEAKRLDCSGTGITSLDVSGCPDLTDIDCGGCTYEIPYDSDSFDMTTLPGNLDPTKVSNVSGADYDPATGMLTKITGNITYIYDCGNGNTAEFTLIWNGTPAPKGVAVDEVNFPDRVFREYVSDNFDTDSNGYLSDEEIAGAAVINVWGTAAGSLTGIEYFPALTTLYCYNTDITSLDLSRNTMLRKLGCQRTGLTNLDVSGCPDLTAFDCSGCTYEIPAESDNFNMTALPGNLDPARVSNISGANFDADTGMLTDITGNVTYTYDCGNGHMAKFTLIWNGTPAPKGVAVDEVNFPDDVFRSYVSENCDTDKDGYLSEEEIAAVNEIRVGGASASDGGITSLKGIENFTALQELVCEYNFNLTSLDISRNTALTKLNCIGTGLTSLDLRNNAALETLWCQRSDITDLDVSNNTALTDLECFDTGITSIDVSRNVSLEYLFCHNTGITSLDVSSNTALTNLDCNNTGIASLNVNNNTALTYLNCSKTGITSLDVSNNTSLIRLDCDNTSITKLDVSNNTALKNFSCHTTDITSLDVSSNTALVYLSCHNTGITNLDIGNCPNLTSLEISGCTYEIPSESDSFDMTTLPGNLVREKVSNVSGADYDAATGMLTDITGNVTYTYDCGNGHTAEFTLIWNGTPAPVGVAVDEVNFPDDVFRSYVSENFDTDKDWYLSEEEIKGVTRIDVGGTLYADGGTASLKGIENFTALTYLECSYNSGLTSLDVSNNTALTELWCSSTEITSLDVSNNTALTSLHCENTKITSLDVNNNTALTALHCDNTNITSLDVSNNTALTSLECNNTKITNLDVSNNTALIYLYCDNTQIISLDVSNNTALTNLSCHTTGITSLDVSNSTALLFLTCHTTGITNLDVSNNTDLSTLYCYNTGITSLDLSNNINLVSLQCHNTGITSLDVSNCKSWISLSCTSCTYEIPSDADSFDMTTLPGNLDTANVSNVFGANYDPSTGMLTNITGNVTYTYDCGLGKTADFTLVWNGTPAPKGVAVDETNFPDTVFREYVSTDFDKDSDGLLSEEEIAGATSIDVGGYSGSLASLKGIEHFTALKTLYCDDNSMLISFDVSNNTTLTTLACNNTGVTSLDVSNNTALKYLYCYDTGITRLDVSNNTALTELLCSNTEITSLDVSNNVALETLWCNNTGITSLDLSKNTALTWLDCSNTGITSLDLSNCPNLATLNCENCKYEIPSDTDSFDMTTLPGNLDQSRVSNVSGADYDPSTGMLTNITGNVTYTYDCGNGQTANFTLVWNGTASASLESETVVSDISETEEPQVTEVSGSDIPETETEINTETEANTETETEINTETEANAESETEMQTETAPAEPTVDTNNFMEVLS